MCLSKKAVEQQKTAGRAELDLEKLKVGPDQISFFCQPVHTQYTNSFLSECVSK